MLVGREDMQNPQVVVEFYKKLFPISLFSCLTVELFVSSFVCLPSSEPASSAMQVELYYQLILNRH